MKCVKDLRKVVCREKLRNRSTLPKDKHAVIKVLEQHIGDQMTPGAYLVKKVVGEIVMLATDESLRILSENCKQVFSDGTFRYAPMYFKQLYSFHVYKDGYYIPVAYFLLRDKTKKTYRTVLRLLLDQCANLGHQLDIENFTVDFEHSMIVALQEIFGRNVSIRGCRFHLGQSWFRYIRDNGLYKTYRDGKCNAAKWMKKCFGLPGIHEQLVGEYFIEDFSKTAPLTECPELQKFIEYLTTYYMKPDSLFPPSMWAGICTIDLKTSNNSVESWHRHFGENFNSRKGKPNIFEFLERLADVDLFSMIAAHSEPTVNKKANAKQEKLRKSYDRLLNKEISKDDFLFSVCSPIAKEGKRRSQRVRNIKTASQNAENQSSIFWTLGSPK